MGRVAVVAFQIVLDDELPVGRQIGLAPAHRAHGGQAGKIRQQALLEPGKAVRRCRVGVVVDHHEPGHLRNGERTQAEVVAVETGNRLAVGGMAQASVQAIGPGVIRAGDDGLERAGAFEQAMGAMAAGVVEGAQQAVASAHECNLLAAAPQGDVAAGSCDLAAMAGRQPGAAEQVRHLALVDGGIGVPGWRKRPLHQALRRERASLSSGVPAASSAAW